MINYKQSAFYDGQLLLEIIRHKSWQGGNYQHLVANVVIAVSLLIGFYGTFYRLAQYLMTASIILFVAIVVGLTDSVGRDYGLPGLSIFLIIVWCIMSWRIRRGFF